MSSIVSELHTIRQARLRSFVWPREHGAWGMLLVPLVTGGWIGLFSGRGISSLLLFGVASLALFCLRTPVEIWLETSPLRPRTPTERQAVFCSIVAYASLAGVALTVLLWQDRAYGLLILGAAVGGLFLAQAVLKKFGRQTRMTAQLVGSLGLTSTAAGAYYIVTGQFDARALVLWGANWLFAANQIHFVQLRIHAARASTRAAKFASGRGFLAGELAMGLLLILVWRIGLLPGAALLAFAPIFARGFLWFFHAPAPLAIHRLGYSELAHALAFGALFILGFYLRLP
jgi:hypothetical protein